MATSSGRGRALARAVFERGFRSGPTAARVYWKCVARNAIDCAGTTGFAGGLPRVALDDLGEGLDSSPVTVLDFHYEFGGINAREMFALCRLARSRAPRAVFEFGTYLGMTTRQLAANTEATIYTLDLPPKGHPDHVETAYWGQPEQPGASFQGTPEADRIVQLYGNSQTYDFSAHAGTMDFVFVDATHDYDEVKRDSRSALEMLAPGGLILWHDYQPHFTGLVQALEELNTEVPIKHLGGTSLALHEREPAG